VGGEVGSRLVKWVKRGLSGLMVMGLTGVRGMTVKG